MNRIEISLLMYMITDMSRSFHHCCSFFFFNDTATTEIYTLSLHDALPISAQHRLNGGGEPGQAAVDPAEQAVRERSEEHTSELQSQSNLVCRLLLEKKKKKQHAPEDSKQENIPPALQAVVVELHIPCTTCS